MSNAQSLPRNPFTVLTPEDMTAEQMSSLFVDVFSDFPKLRDQGHTFIHGPRGSGKSMMFRYLEPDCQRLALACGLSDLDFYGIYLSLKNTQLDITEFQRLESMHASIVLNEHFMTMCLSERTFDSLVKHCADCSRDHLEDVKRFIRDALFGLLHACGWEDQPCAIDELSTPLQCFQYAQEICGGLFRNVINYLKRLSFTSEPQPFSGPLCGYLDFLLPLLKALKQLPFIPRGPVYLLIDDADDLNHTQTRVLNSWVSSRTSAFVSIKISTQLQYKTYLTLVGQTIDAPHDYSEVNISTVYTTKKGTYRDRLRRIVEKRLESVRINGTPEEFFPDDREQEEAIAHIAEELRANWATEGRGARAADDALRYARPDFIRSLGGPSKSRSSYSYAGFDQMVHVSSGVIRYFLDAAAVMFNETIAETPEVRCIPPARQNEVLRRQANEFLYNEIAKQRISYMNSPDGPALLQQLDKLRNLIDALGGTFELILNSARSERRVFSMAFSDSPDRDVLDVLALGERLGYFQLSTIGNKEGTGRTTLYILSRRLAPLFTLDPTSFAGYLFVTTQAIRQAMENPQRLLRQIKAKGIEEMGESRQLELFD